MELQDDLMDVFADEDPEWDCLPSKKTETASQQAIQNNVISTDEDTPQPEHLEVLKRYFGHSSFRRMQWKIINSIINKRQDNCAIMATGYGKSLCYQYPSVYCKGVTIVISPLISLMEDQVLALKVMNIPACLLGSAQTKQNVVLQEILENKYYLVYMTPEFCCGDGGRELLSDMNKMLNVVLIAIDEAHCVSTWGHDFRKQYRELGLLHSLLPTVPILAVTATATVKVRNDIVSSLQLRNPQVLCSGFDRPNLYFEVRTKQGGGIFPDLTSVMIRDGLTHDFAGSTIIYTITRKQAEDVASELKTRGINCRAYHAGLTIKQRKEAHELFVRDEIKIMVATIAFGMGIDKPDIRYIIHYGCSKDIESYYQEVGRAGRDGQPSKCITFYSAQDFKTHELVQEHYSSNVEQKAEGLKYFRQYLETRDCRRKFILEHFEGNSATNSTPNTKCCDNCRRSILDGRSDYEKYEGLNSDGLYDFTNDARLLLESIRIMGGRTGLGNYILFLRGSQSSKIKPFHKKHPKFGCGKGKTEAWWKGVGRMLDVEGYLKKTKKATESFKYEVIDVSDKGLAFLSSTNLKLLLKPCPEIFKLLKVKQGSSSSAWLDTADCGKPKPQTTNLKSDFKLCTVTLRGEDFNVYKLLMNRRHELASRYNCMPYMIASNETLMKLANLKPCTVEELRECELDGFTDAKIDRFGEEFLNILRNYSKPGQIVKPRSKPAETWSNYGGPEKVLSLDEQFDEKMDVSEMSSDPRTSKPTILEVLMKNPLPNSKLNATQINTYKCYEDGMTVKEIATKRGLLEEVVFTHLINAMRVGYPIKLLDLNVTNEIKAELVRALQQNASPDELTNIKESLNITNSQVLAVKTYLEVRTHLSQLEVEYEDFEDDDRITMNPMQMLLHFAETQVKPPVTFKETSVEPPRKKMKPEESATPKMDALKSDLVSSSNLLNDTAKNTSSLETLMLESPSGKQGIRTDVNKRSSLGAVILESPRISSSSGQSTPDLDIPGNWGTPRIGDSAVNNKEVKANADSSSQQPKKFKFKKLITSSQTKLF